MHRGGETPYLELHQCSTSRHGLSAPKGGCENNKKRCGCWTGVGVWREENGKWKMKNEKWKISTIRDRVLSRIPLSAKHQAVSSQLPSWLHNGAFTPVRLIGLPISKGLYSADLPCSCPTRESRALYQRLTSATNAWPSLGSWICASFKVVYVVLLLIISPISNTLYDTRSWSTLSHKHRLQTGSDVDLDKRDWTKEVSPSQSAASVNKVCTGQSMLLSQDT